MGFVWKIAKTTKIPVIKYKSLYFSNLYSIFRRFSILFVNLITVHEVLPHYVSCPTRILQDYGKMTISSCVST